jgi:hypothetical protein
MAMIDFALLAFKVQVCIWGAVLILIGSHFLEDLIRGSRSVVASDETRRESLRGGSTNVASEAS